MRALAATTLLMSGGCAAGPDYVRPGISPDAGYLPGAAPGAAGASPPSSPASARLVDGMDIPGAWWQVFQSPPLDSLITQALAHNPDLAAAQAGLDQAHELALAQRGSYCPSLSAGFAASRQRTSAQLAPTPNSGALEYSLFTPQLSISYEPDVFGLNRRTVEAMDAQSEQARFALIATHITLSATVAATAIQEASLRAQIGAYQQQVDIAQRMVEAVSRQFAAGYADRLDVAIQEALLGQVRAALPPLRKQLAQERDLLADLTGGFPNQALDATFPLSSLTVPEDLPVSLPSRLVEQRPDVRQAEANLHAACARIGIAAASRLPSFSLTGDLGSMALTAGTILAGGTSFWGLAEGVTQPIFMGGALLHEERAAKAAYEMAAQQYRSTVLTAYENVADALHALSQDGDAVTAAAEGLDAAKVTLDLTRQQLASGYATDLAVLTAEQAYQQALVTVAQAQANRFVDTVALFQALGGGWWNRTDLPSR